MSCTHKFIPSWRIHSEDKKYELIRTICICLPLVAGREEVVSIFPSKSHKLHTTHSWDFLNTIDSFPAQNSDPSGCEASGQDIIVGVFDSGIWPESKSFNDTISHGCQNASKLIGARFYTNGYDASDPELQKTFIKSARDTDGHGTHTASTAAGRIVNGISFPGGLGAGAARGGSPNSRVAAYKVCWDDCKDPDILAGFDDAIADGVDIISASIGPDPPQANYFEDAISIGAFHALQKNILVSCSAGNSGDPFTATNLSPWILTVAASSIDRRFEADVVLGNGKILQVIQVIEETQWYLVALLRSFCHADSLDDVKTKGKIVVCQHEIPIESRGAKAAEVSRAGGAGMIDINPEVKDLAQPFVVPASLTDEAQASILRAYLNSTSSPMAKFLKTNVVLHDKPSPKVAFFSSRGPNTVTPDIIKPDITAPGLTILAAWPPIATAGAGNRSVDYNFLSGTSMACPHITGVAALLKARFPYWTAAMIKSAMMTTGKELNTFTNTPATPFDFGSGHVNPVAAQDPGLVYDISLEEYTSFACGLGPSPGALKNLTITACPPNPIASYNLNYPSIGVADLRGSLSVTRSLTNVGPAQSHYRAKVYSPPGVIVSVYPSELQFTRPLQKISFTVSLSVQQRSQDFVFGALVWSDGKHFVRSPIAVNATAIAS
ncbi:subtilisin-like protease SBT5.3 [Selaginella moellendorffii]|uniref:subtilisin-like protease SBT5.3 n=1 Tax=Selaginella moellendorffii TaxID=88036 RepID=UPI000D1D0F27|nr:subtilisin-like protease SBT5.3 [Selaginella moellendorffii]|eukprot:XP_024532780.1 subtilisin-like protease SBT5.3 [Selaginella moellendorffii]